jgi:hypothetical protein
MKLIIESTSKVVTVDGVPARIWEGETQTGVRVHCYITRVAVENAGDQTQFERELALCKAPSPAIEAIPLRLIL